MIKIKSCTKWSAVVITATILLMIMRGCAPKWEEKTNASMTNNQTPAYNYSEYFESLADQMSKLTETKQTKKIK